MSRQKKQKDTLEDIENTIKGKNKPTPVEKIYAPTGSFLMDLVVGGGVGYGFPFGRIINFVADKSSGKSFMACEVIAACHYKYGKNFKWIYDDCESGFSFNTENLYGFEIMPPTIEERTKSNTVEQAYTNVREFAESLEEDEFGIYVIDSLDGLKSKEAKKRMTEKYNRDLKQKYNKEEKEKKEKGTFGVEKPKFLSQDFFPDLSDIIEKTNCLLIIISQVRQNIDPMSFEKFTRNGGKAMDFYCHTVFWLANINKIKKRGRAIGVTIKAKTTKSKTPRPYREMCFELKFDYGLDDIATCVDFLFDFRTPTGELTETTKASWENGKELTLENLKIFLQENEVEDEYRNTVNEKLKKSEVMGWLEEHPTLGEKYKKTFLDKMSRDDLIKMIEDNNLVDELHRRTEEKWEEIELSIKSLRKPKYR